MQDILYPIFCNLFYTELVSLVLNLDFYLVNCYCNNCVVWNHFMN